MTAADLHLGYRSSALDASQVVVSAELALSAGDPRRGQAELSEIVRWRREHQPGGQNAGSVFTNPPGDSAGRLIDAAGCRGLRIGTAEVSTKHANFIQADPGGSADDVAALMREVASRVRDHAGVELHAETVVVGFRDEASR
jgi:UDP-N-acetylmuramate dehydrogenase